MLKRIKTIIRSVLAHVPAMQYRKSYALNYLDQRLEPFLIKRGGFFVEAGANDGVRQSNTLYFERYLGWNGLLIEPIPYLADQCRANRPKCLVEQAALVSSQYDRERITIHSCGLMSATQGAFGNEQVLVDHIESGRQHLNPDETTEALDVPARTLTTIFDQHRVPSIDLLSLDVEGYEHEALAGLDFKRYSPRYLLIEVRDRALIESVLPEVYRPIAVLSMNSRYEDILYMRHESVD